MPARASPGARHERIIALWLRLLADGAPTDAWVPMRHLRNAVVATTQIGSRAGVRDHLARGEDFGILERRRVGNEWLARLRPVNAEGQFLPLPDLDLPTLLNGTGSQSHNGEASTVADLMDRYAGSIEPVVELMHKDARRELDGPKP